MSGRDIADAALSTLRSESLTANVIGSETVAARNNPDT
jgi:hypothetical protein